MRLRMSRYPSRNPFGDKASLKVNFVGSCQHQIVGGASTITQTPVMTVFDYNSLGTIVTQLNAANFGNVSTPPGLNTWLNMFQSYRVNACRLTLEVFSEGNTPEAGTGFVPYTPFVALAADGITSISAVPINSAAYWTYSNIRNQRWARTKTLTAPGSTGARTRISLYITNRALVPDKYERDQSFEGSITPSTGVSPKPVLTTPPLSNLIGFRIANLSGVNNLSSVTSNFTTRILLTLYVSAWDKVPTSYIP